MHAAVGEAASRREGEQPEGRDGREVRSVLRGEAEEGRLRGVRAGAGVERGGAAGAGELAGGVG